MNLSARQVRDIRPIKQKICRSIDAKIGSRQTVGMIIYIAERSLEALERVVVVGRESLQKR